MPNSDYFMHSDVVADFISNGSVQLCHHTTPGTEIPEKGFFSLKFVEKAEIEVINFLYPSHSIVEDYNKNSNPQCLDLLDEMYGYL